MNRIILKIIFQTYHQLRGTNVYTKLKELRNTQWLSIKEIEELQHKKLVALLQHAYKNVPFYRKRFKEVGLKFSDLEKKEVLKDIPFLTKKDINENLMDILAINIKKKQLIPNSTSGSTGESLYFYTDMNSWAWIRATEIRNKEWLNVFLGDKIIKLWGALIDIKKANSLRNRIHRWFNNYIILSSYELSNSSMEQYVKIINRFKPILLVSYPGPLTEFSKFLIQNKINIASIKAIISSAETLYQWQKDIIEEAFHCPVYNRYGCREFGDIAQECLFREGLHINAERLIVEIIDDDFKVCKPNDIGEIIITDLDNYGMPFIRYKIGDLGAFSDKSCKCGRGLPLLKTIEGRTLDVIKTPEGNRLGGTFWSILFKSKPGIKSFQVIQEDINGIVVKYVKEENYKDIPKEYFIKKIKEKCGRDFEIDFIEVREIPKTKSGKTRFIVSKLKNE